MAAKWKPVDWLRHGQRANAGRLRLFCNATGSMWAWFIEPVGLTGGHSLMGTAHSLEAAKAAAENAAREIAREILRELGDNEKETDR